MVDSLTRYYMQKANLRTQDQFQTEISSEDMVVLKKARAYVFVAPVILLLGMHFIVWI